MTMDDRIAAVARLGFTERQTRFLVHVMLFSGICLPRQYARSACTAYGHNVTEFFARLVQNGHATAPATLLQPIHRESHEGPFDLVSAARLERQQVLARREPC